jgi:hypothetical protein
MTTIRRLITALAGLAFALGYLATSALAQPAPDGPSGPLAPPPPVTPPASYGSPIWQFALVAAAAVVVTVLLTLAVNALRHHAWAESKIAHA